MAFCRFTSIDQDAHDVWVNPLQVLSAQRYSTVNAGTMITLAGSRGEGAVMAIVREGPDEVAGTLSNAVHAIYGSTRR